MCGPAVPWDWLLLDVSYVLVLVGGAMVLRARRSSTQTWLVFGILGALVGGLLLAATWVMGPAAASSNVGSAVDMLASC